MRTRPMWAPFIAVMLALTVIVITAGFKSSKLTPSWPRQLYDKARKQPAEEKQNLREKEQTPEPPTQESKRSVVSDWSSKVQEKAESMPSPEPEPHKREPVPLEGGTERDNREIGVQDLTSLFPRDIVREGPTAKPSIALTFDDGPDGIFTPAILDILKQYQIKATFFVTGVRSTQFPEILRRIVNEGHALGQHGYSHGNYSAMTTQEIKADLKKTDDTIYKIARVRTRLFRPPYGALSESATKAIINEGYKIILWSIDSLDWRNLSRIQVRNNILPHVHNGSIILQHCAGGQGQDLSGTVQALPDIITTLKEAGFTFKTIPSLLDELSSTRNVIDIR
jgi:peptidoglycan/xylan/chitin deacetylase (PgdA/CDA1 family)